MMSTSNLVFKDMPGSFGDRLGFEVNVAATKWFHPVFGARLQLAGGRFRNISQLGGNTQRTPYMFVHTDLMINFSNWAAATVQTAPTTPFRSSASVTWPWISRTARTIWATAPTRSSPSRPVC